MPRIPDAIARRGLAALVALLLVGGLGATVTAPPTAAAAPVAAAADAAPVEVTGLTTNGRVDPLGIPGADPRLGWYGESAGRGVVQSAYQVRVASSEDALADADVWDSGKVASERQVDVRYGGPALASQTRYVWQVRTWDGDDRASEWSEPASFETGILDPDEWQADWIAESAAGEVDRWTDYTADIDFDIDHLAIGVFVRARDTSNALMWQISTADGSGVPKFRPHRRVDNGYELLGNVPILGITSAQLLTGTHRLSIRVDGPTITTFLDGTQIDERTDATFAKGFVGFRQDFATGQGDEAAHIKAVRVTAENGDVLLDTDFSDGNPFDGGRLTAQGLLVADRTDVLYRSIDANKPLLRTSFTTPPDKTVASARVYASAHGVYELQLNGEKVGDQFLAPGWTDYNTRIQHQTYDVTDQVRSGENAFGAELGDGWWAGKIAWFGVRKYGPQVGLIAQLRIDYTDGSSQVVATDGTWTSHAGPYVVADNVEGESYDARAAQPGWDEPDFDDAGWEPVTPATDTTARLVPQPDEPVRATEEIPAKEHTTPAPGVEIYDLGQNMVGVARMRLQGQAGSTVTIRYGEELNPDGTLYTANLRSAKATDTYTFAATGAVTYTPKFTQHGFRYLEITGTAVAPALADVTGVVWGSDLRATGDLATSDTMLNQLISNISWGQRGNFLSIPTDTPARDERLGWTGDINVFAPTASYLRDTRGFLAKWMTDLRDGAYADGNFPGVAPVVPNGDVGAGLGWSDAGITVPYATWKAWGDGRIVRENYAAMEKFLGFVRTSAGADLIDSGRGHWEDWLNLDDPTGVGVLGTLYFAEDARMLSEMAAAIGEHEDAAEYAELSTAVRRAFVDEFVSADGTVEGNSQAGYAMALGMDMIADPALREKVAARFVAKLADSDYHLTTGFLGTPWLLPALSDIGRDDLAYTMLTHTDYPSWGYEIEKGATTMWERWNSIMPDGSFGPVDMNSFNHYAYGAVGDWMYRNIGGIAPLEAGYKAIRIAPVVGGGLTHVAGQFRSAYGPISTDWTAEGADLTLAVDVPVNTTAEVVLPAANAFAVTEGGELLDDVEGVAEVTDDGDTVTVTVGSGSYDFATWASSGATGAIALHLDELRAHVGELADAGDVTAAQREQLDSAVDAVRAGVRAALLADMEGDGAAATAALADALDAAGGLRELIAAAELSEPVRADLAGRVAVIEGLLVNAYTASLGVAVALPPAAGVTLPGGTVAGTVEVTNTGTAALRDLEGTVTVADLGEATVSLAAVPAGGSAQLPFNIEVPAAADPGAYDAGLALELTLDGEPFTITAATPAWASVTSGLAVGDITASLDDTDPADHAVLTVPVSNAGTADVRAHVAVDLPAGWRSVPSPDVLLPAGETVEVTVPVAVPLDRTGSDPIAVGAVVRRGGAVLAEGAASLTLPSPRPPAGAVDHVDFGDAASEAAHAVTGSPSSGTNEEAGLSRRYANSNNPGSWFSAEVQAPSGQPFVLRNVETFAGAFTKKYDIYLDGVLVREHLLPRAEGGQGSKVYDLLVTDPDVLDHDGTVVVRYEYRVGTRVQDGFFDPSIADLWVLPVGPDTRGPDVSAVVASGAGGHAGWHRSDVTVAVAAADNRDPLPVVETRDGPAWAPYAGPVAVTGDGKRELTYRATDAAGNVSTGTLPVWIDTEAPSTTVTATRGAGVEGADRATLTFASSDVTSGVAATVYRIDGGDWETLGSEEPVVTGFGDHVVEFASTDAAGNVEALRRETISLADVDVVAALVAPQVTGTARYGSTLRATPGSWNTKGLTFDYQWLRNGAAIPGAESESYRVAVADVGRRLSVRVTATKPGLAPGVSTSTETAPVAKAVSRTTVQVDRASVRPGQPVAVTVLVASDPQATGTVAVRVDGRVVRRAALRGGKAVVTLRLRRPGRHRVVAAYLGSDRVAPSTSTARVIRVSPAR